MEEGWRRAACRLALRAWSRGRALDGATCVVLFITCRGGCQMFGAWLELGREHLRHAGEVAMCGVGAWTSSRIIRGVWVVT
jgi:hypothetical protein